ncbi:hypothetical protein BC937DRAFT_93704 [Endogone sp. FLAS-F59071]|nr:hypothetical protein BC937DRAFT_93704 [Endogone sp. FLAS-F59071]|eukprot:RUS14511.1 hypothetical protein BC937DRAFT_93704 [Endogone sp. FLAS-F59071]
MASFLRSLFTSIAIPLVSPGRRPALAAVSPISSPISVRFLYKLKTHSGAKKRRVSGHSKSFTFRSIIIFHLLIHSLPSTVYQIFPYQQWKLQALASRPAPSESDSYARTLKSARQVCASKQHTEADAEEGHAIRCHSC